MTRIQIRRSIISDAEQIYNLRKDPDAAQWSFSDPPRSLQEHIAWFQKKLTSKTTRYYSVIYGKMIGFVRLDDTDNGTEISVVIDPEMRGRGIAKRAIVEVMKIDGYKRYYATIIIGNTSSFKAFSKVNERGDLR